MVHNVTIISGALRARSTSIIRMISSDGRFLWPGQRQIDATDHGLGAAGVAAGASYRVEGLLLAGHFANEYMYM